MHRPLSLLVLALAALLLGTAGRAADDKSTFFNGKDLTGWEGKDGMWKAENGAIVGTTDGKLKANTFLCTRDKYKDFELSFQVRLKDAVGNSGVQIRSQVFDPKEYRVKGPQVDIGKGYWGSLYGEGFGGMMQASSGDLIKKAVKETEFNDYSIKCVGQRVTIKVNGETMVDETFDKAWAEKNKKMPLPEEGIIALQAHVGPAMEVTFKNIKFTDLSKK